MTCHVFATSVDISRFCNSSPSVGVPSSFCVWISVLRPKAAVTLGLWDTPLMTPGGHCETYEHHE
jgi:hypothetical protein